MSGSIRILHVDDDPKFADLTATFLEREDDRFTVETATSATDGLDRLTEEIDCIVSDYEMPVTNGIEFLEAVRDEYPDLPFILFTGKGNEEVASDAISAGVTDYLQKQSGTQQYELLGNQISNAVEAYHSKRSLTTDETTVEAESLSADGDRDPYRSAGARPTDSAGDRIGLVGPGRDISARRERDSARRERERDLKRQKRQFEAVFNNPVSFVGILDPDGRVRRANEPARDFIDVPVDEIVGEPFWETSWWDHSTELQTDIQERIDRAADGEVIRFDADHYGPDGERVVMDGMVYPVTDTDGRVTAIVATGRDITEQREREHVLKEIQEVTADADRSFTEQVDELLSIGRDALGMAYGTFSRIDGDNYVIEAIRGPPGAPDPGHSMSLSETVCERTMRNEETVVIEDLEQERPESSDRAEFLEAACYIGTPVTAAGDVYGTLCFADERPADEFSEWEITVVDLITQWVSYELTRQKTQDRLKQQNERLERFASIVSHDLRNPLNVAEGRLELARTECESEHLDDLAQALDRMSALVDDILALAREGERVSETEAVDLAALSETCWRNVETPGATLVTDTERTIRADRSRLQQLLENLVRNAVEHSSASSRPAADDAVDHGGESVVVTIGDLDGDTGFYVADDGPGIPEDEREKVFESGYSTSDEGIGFGLSIVGEIAKAHGWVSSVTESDEGGARFEIADVELAEE